MYLRKRSAISMALAILTGAMALAPAMPALAAAYAKVSGIYQMKDGTPIPNVFARGIDVSHWKQNIDWNAVAADDVKFVMLGTRYDNKVDPYFRINADGAHKAGIKLGAYIYSYAVTPEMAVQEADFVLDLIKDYPISYPVAFDVEANVQSTLSPNELNAIINAFCERIEQAGYYPMVYANDYWLKNKIDTSQLKYEVWAARYEAMTTFPNPAIWQATSTGTISGIQGNVDINFQFKDLSGSLPANRWRTIAGKTYYYQDYTMQKNAWIQDGTGWFYIDENGQPTKGWFTTADSKYYLDAETGKMATGWKSFDGKWNYFKDSGKLATGWVNDNNNYYYMSSEGVMTTGWTTIDNKHYYLRDSGVMATGWENISNTWYYFNNGGDMASGWINPDGSYYHLAQDGKMTTGWFTEGDSTYYLSSSSGRMTIGWRQSDGFWYHFDSSGKMQTGVITDDGKMYYLDPSSGKMAASTTMTIDGTEYQIDASGVCTKPEAAPETTTNTGGQPPAETQAQAPQESSPASAGPGVIVPGPNQQ